MLRCVDANNTKQLIFASMHPCIICFLSVGLCEEDVAALQLLQNMQRPNDAFVGCKDQAFLDSCKEQELQDSSPESFCYYNIMLERMLKQYSQESGRLLMCFFLDIPCLLALQPKLQAGKAGRPEENTAKLVFIG